MIQPKVKGQSIFDSLYFHLLIFLFALFITRVLAADYPKDELKNTFAANFIEWFGVLYGILLPLIMVRVWEQLDDIDREFDREADIVRIMYEDLAYLPEKSQKIGVEIAVVLRDYVVHVTKNYEYEVKESTEEKNTKREKQGKTNAADEEKRADKVILKIWMKMREQFIKLINPNEHKTSESARKVGDDILLRIRRRFSEVLYPDGKATKATNDVDFIVKELFQRLNEIVDIRGDRIGFASQRLFQTLRIVALIASIVFLAPFYILGFSGQTSLLDNILIFGVTLLVVFIYMIIEDFDEPFGGTWKIDDESWQDLLNAMNSDGRLPPLEDPNKQIQVERTLSESSPESGTAESNHQAEEIAGKQLSKKNVIVTVHGSTSSKKKPSKRKKSL